MSFVWSERMADGGDSEDVLPAVFFAEDVEHHTLASHGAQLSGILLVRHAQQESVTEGYDVEKPQLSGAEQQRAVEEVAERSLLVLLQGIVMGIQVADALQEFHLRRKSLLAEEFDGIGGVAADAVEGKVGIDEALHFGLQVLHHLRCDTAFDVERAEVASGERGADAQAGTGEVVVDGLVEHKEEAAGVGA